MRLMMEGEKKKRKMTNIVDEEEEDVKIEKFFTLIRSAKNIRDQLLDSEGPSKARPKKAVAISGKKAEAVRMIHKIDEKSFAAATAAAEKEAAVLIQRAAAAIAAAAEVVPGGSATVAAESGDAEMVSRSAAEEKGKKTDQKNNYNGGRISIDLNLSL